MKKEIKKKWLKALRSDKYIQGEGALCTTNSVDTFCCIGVLCNVRAEGNKKRYWRETDSKSDNPLELIFLGGSSVLTDSMLQWAGLTEDEQDKLAEMNDLGNSFQEIADYIEETH